MIKTHNTFTWKSKRPQTVLIGDLKSSCILWIANICFSRCFCLTYNMWERGNVWVYAHCKYLAYLCILKHKWGRKGMKSHIIHIWLIRHKSYLFMNILFRSIYKESFKYLYADLPECVVTSQCRGQGSRVLFAFFASGSCTSSAYFWSRTTTCAGVWICDSPFFMHLFLDYILVTVYYLIKQVLP